MKKADFFFVCFLVIVFLPFFLFQEVFQFYSDFNREHAYLMSFIKFFFLAPIGEIIGLRIHKGIYREKNFGLLPRAIVWGCLGVTVKMAFDIFSSGAPVMLHKIWEYFPANAMEEDFSFNKLVGAFAISVTLNIFYAPVLMTAHKIAEEHIIWYKGRLKGFFRPIRVNKIVNSINWQVMWNFVFKKTIPLFWIPVQTINFLLPKEYQILVAALLGIVLGVILEASSLKGRSKL